jgi:uncharacterized protein YjiS (DUF1127 family)
MTPPRGAEGGACPKEPAMTFLSDATYSARGRAPRPWLARLGAVALRIALWPARVVAARRTLTQLAALSEYELRDIGLSRQDLVDLTGRPLDEDPTPHLTGSRAARARAAHSRRLPG